MRMRRGCWTRCARTDGHRQARPALRMNKGPASRDAGPLCFRWARNQGGSGLTLLMWRGATPPHREETRAGQPRASPGSPASLTGRPGNMLRRNAGKASPGQCLPLEAGNLPRGTPPRPLEAGNLHPETPAMPRRAGNLPRRTSAWRLATANPPLREGNFPRRAGKKARRAPGDDSSSGKSPARKSEAEVRRGTFPVPRGVNAAPRTKFPAWRGNSASGDGRGGVIEAVRLLATRCGPPLEQMRR